MAVTFNTYSGLASAVSAWRAGSAVAATQFDNFLANCETRMYYGYATDDPSNPLHSDALRIVEMETVDTAFQLYSASTPGTIAQPATFLELISAYTNTIPGPMQIVAQRVMDGYAGRSIGGTKLIAVSGTNFRTYDPPSASLTATLRYYQKLTTPTAAASNLILTNYPHVYLYGCLVEEAIMTQDQPAATAYLALYNTAVQGLNSRTQRITASANPAMRFRGGPTP